MRVVFRRLDELALIRLDEHNSSSDDRGAYMRHRCRTARLAGAFRRSRLTQARAWRAVRSRATHSRRLRRAHPARRWIRFCGRLSLCRYRAELSRRWREPVALADVGRAMVVRRRTWVVPAGFVYVQSRHSPIHQRCFVASGADLPERPERLKGGVSHVALRLDLRRRYGCWSVGCVPLLRAGCGGHEPRSRPDIAPCSIARCGLGCNGSG